MPRQPKDDKIIIEVMSQIRGASQGLRDRMCLPGYDKYYQLKEARARLIEAHGWLRHLISGDEDYV